MVAYFRSEAGYAATPSVATGVPNKESLKNGGAKDAGGSAVKQVFGKVKGVFKKKK